jgi:hypothetical protein
MENAGIFYGHLEYFTVIWYSLWPFGNVVVIWYIFPCFGILCQEKSGNPDTEYLCQKRTETSSWYAIPQNPKFVVKPVVHRL